MSEIEELFNKADEIKTYPNSMGKIRGGIKAVAFYPGGKGLINLSDQTISNKSIMVVGQDFDTLDNYNKLVKNGREDIHKNKTWHNLLDFLESVAIQPDNCFFTNAIQGARIDSKSTGKSPAFKSDEFIKDCQSFFLHQLSVQKPKVILVLGIQTAKFISDLSLDLKSWSNYNSIKEFDKNEQQIAEATFINGVKGNVVLLTHPSFRKLNVKHRFYKGHQGEKAEVELVKTALECYTIE